MAKAASELIRFCAVDQLQDPDAVRWTTRELVSYLNDGQREIITYRPDATSAMTAMPLVAGAQQSIPATAMKLLGQVRNTASGIGVRLVDRKVLDAFAPGWQTEAGSNAIVNYVYDERDPTAYLVYPPAADTEGSLDALLSLYPTDIEAPSSDDAVWSDVAGAVSVSDEYVNALQDYILYRAYRKDAEYGGNAEAAQHHYSRFSEAMGVELQGTVAAAPRAKDERGG